MIFQRFWKLVFTTLIPVLLILSSSLIGIIVFDLQKEQVLKDTPLKQTADTLHQNGIEHAQALDVFFSRIESMAKSIGSFAEQVWENNETSERSSYFHNPTINAPADLEYSAKHQQQVSFSTSAYKIAPTAYENSTDYLNQDEDLTFGEWSAYVNHTINLSASLDLLFSPMYDAMDEILWIYMGFEDGVHRTYPYHGPFNKEYDPRSRPWYLTALDTLPGDVAFTTPYIDATTSKVVATAVIAIHDGANDLIGVIGIDFNLGTIQSEVLNIELGRTTRSFLVNTDFNIIAHPDHILPSASWQSSDLEVSITSVETTNEDFTDLLQQARTGSDGQSIIDYGGSEGRQLVSVIPLNGTNMILGMITPYTETTLDQSSSDVILIVALACFIILVSATMVISWQQQKIQHGISVDTKKRFCIECSTLLKEDDIFCRNCGTINKNNK